MTNVSLCYSIISHIVEACEGQGQSPTVTGKGSPLDTSGSGPRLPPMDWGEHQLRTSCNWASSWYSVTGMLDLQIEHHLFPSLPYAVQKEIQPLVRETAAEFGIPYNEHSSLADGLAKHMRFMHKLGWGWKLKLAAKED